MHVKTFSFCWSCILNFVVWGRKNFYFCRRVLHDSSEVEAQAMESNIASSIIPTQSSYTSYVDTCNGQVIMECFPEFRQNPSEWDDVVDFIECKLGKDYSSWLKKKERFRMWKYERRCKRKIATRIVKARALKLRPQKNSLRWLQPDEYLAGRRKQETESVEALMFRCFCFGFLFSLAFLLFPFPFRLWIEPIAAWKYELLTIILWTE